MQPRPSCGAFLTEVTHGLRVLVLLRYQCLDQPQALACSAGLYLVLRSSRSHELSMPAPLLHTPPAPGKQDPAHFLICERLVRLLLRRKELEPRGVRPRGGCLASRLAAPQPLTLLAHRRWWGGRPAARRRGLGQRGVHHIRSARCCPTAEAGDRDVEVQRDHIAGTERRPLGSQMRDSLRISPLTGPRPLERPLKI